MYKSKNICGIYNARFNPFSSSFYMCIGTKDYEGKLLVGHLRRDRPPSQGHLDAHVTCSGSCCIRLHLRIPMGCYLFSRPEATSKPKGSLCVTPRYTADMGQLDPVIRWRKRISMTEALQNETDSISSQNASRHNHVRWWACWCAPDCACGCVLNKQRYPFLPQSWTRNGRKLFRYRDSGRKSSRAQTTGFEASQTFLQNCKTKKHLHNSALTVCCCWSGTISVPLTESQASCKPKGSSASEKLAGVFISMHEIYLAK